LFFAMSTSLGNSSLFLYGGCLAKLVRYIRLSFHQKQDYLAIQVIRLIPRVIQNQRVAN
jgi:hypothetical protein